MFVKLLLVGLLALASNVDAQCKVVDIPNGTPDPIVGQTVNNGSVLSVVCDPGFAASPSSTTCTGTTFNATLTCDAFYCAAGPTVTNSGTVTPSLPGGSGYTGNDQVTASCPTGFASTVGANTAECTATNTWTPASLDCTAFFCDAPPTVTNGGSVTPTLPNGGSGYTGNTNVTVSCGSGYQSTAGADTAECTASNKWTPASLDCTAFSCAAQPNVSNGNLSASLPTDGHPGNTKLNITCDSGYESLANAATETECTATDTWTPSGLNCTAITCTALEIPNGSVNPAGDSAFNDEVTVSCKSGYKINGTATLKCDGTLENNYNVATPRCENGGPALFKLQTALMVTILSMITWLSTQTALL